MKDQIDIDYSVSNLLKVASHLHAKTGLGIDHFLDECKYFYKQELEVIKENENENS